MMDLVRLVDHSVWANRVWTEFVFSEPTPEPRPLELLGHMMVGERVWFERVAGAPKTGVDFPVLGKDELLRGFEENRGTYLGLLATRPTDDIQFRRASGEEYHATVLEIIHHLLTHGYHHRGQLAAHYARKGVKYPNTDHINYLIEHQL